MSNGNLISSEPMIAADERRQPSTQQIVFHKFNGRLAMFRHDAGDKDHWENRWSKNNLADLLESYRNGKLDEFEGIFTRYLPKDLPVLEAGCGMGQLVMALAARGYQIEGLDYAEATVARLREAAPELNVRTGDVYQLDVPDETYGGYISIGLFEHNPDGPQAALCETRRVLHRKGVAMISVPYLNRKRAPLLVTVPPAENECTPDGLKFYQYYFTREEFEKEIRNAGLRVIECLPYGVHTGLVRGSPFWQWLGHQRFFIWPVHRRFVRWCANAPAWARSRWAHMLMFVCERA